jgi:ribosomal protein L11 methyltransferase
LLYPALDVDGLDSDFLLALVDDCSPSAVDTNESVVTIFFPDAAWRDRARDVVARAHPQARVQARDVDDEDWAKRSQENLRAITVGRVTVAPPWDDASDSGPKPATERPEPRDPRPVIVVIAPSMGFGTGHHASTRLCLRALQELTLTGLRILDVGTGSGVLAIAARRLGAAEAIGIDDDPDAIHAATENLAHNPDVVQVRFEVGDLRTSPLPAADVITANLTGALLIRTADLLLRILKPGGSLIVSGLQSHERDDVIQAFADATVAWEATEDEWVGLLFRL